MSKPISNLIRADKAISSFPEPGLQRRILTNNDKLMLLEHRMAVGWKGARHSHPHEQIVYVIEGKLRFTCGDETFEIRPGDSLIVPGGVEHQAEAIEPSVVLDVFHPTRNDYLS